MTTEIQYPIFLKLSSRMVDSFYKYMYEDLSYGILPYGLYLQDNYLCCYLKHKEFSYKLGDDADIKEIHNLLKKSGILSVDLNHDLSHVFQGITSVIYVYNLLYTCILLCMLV